MFNLCCLKKKTEGIERIKLINCMNTDDKMTFPRKLRSFAYGS